MTQEALKLALEALKDNQHLVADNERHAYVMEYNSIIEKCKEALAQPEQEPVAWADHGVVNWIVDKQFKHASYLYEGSPPAPSKACIYCGQLVIKEKNT